MSFVEDLSELVAANAAGVLSVAPHWQRAALGSVASVINGFAFPSKHFKASKGFPLVRIRDVVDGRSDTLYDGPIPEGYWVNDGDLLVGMDGDFNCALWRGGKALLNQRVCKIVPDETRLRKQFLLYVLPGYLKLINDYTSSVTVKHLSSRTLQQLPLPLPELAEQDRLIARIDALFAEIDEGEAALAEARAGVETYRKALLKAAVTGELTADWRAVNLPEESGEALLSHLLDDVETTRNKGKAKRRSKVQPVEFAPDVLDLMWEVPPHWQWMPLGSVAFVTKLAGFEYTKFVRYAEDGDLPVIKAENAGLHGFKVTEYSRVHAASVSELDRSKLFGGELLMVFVGAGTGNVATVPYDQQYFLGPNIAMIRLETSNVEPRYVELFLRSIGGKALAMAFAKAVAQPSLSMGTIRQIPIAVPPHREQLAILRELEEAIDKGDDAGDLVAGARSGASTLRQSILTAAFRGELAA